MHGNSIRWAVIGLGLMVTPALGQGDGTMKPGASPPLVPPGASVPLTPVAPAPIVLAPVVPGPGVAGDSALNGGDRTAAVADVVSTHSVDQLLQQAGQALRQNNPALANELIERAEAQVLTRSTIAGTETIPNRVGPIGRMAEARAAIARRDTSSAQALIAEAGSMARAQGM
ncbi:hypothetical protein [Roseomonas fluvialis]|uniref:Uncharacterized protein n=1 Tax=Roseomonas fluvialis TaxID=1750527 RepID=A0ABM7YAA1_9PROT|nr:hypothetical protein [Roseomonas fluvialis]BDG75026.1 hypothetical protein Rmf_49550 [Roseomonas fluvialis]